MAKRTEVEDPMSSSSSEEDVKKGSGKIGGGIPPSKSSREEVHTNMLRLSSKIQAQADQNLSLEKKQSELRHWIKALIDKVLLDFEYTQSQMRQMKQWAEIKTQELAEANRRLTTRWEEDVKGEWGRNVCVEVVDEKVLEGWVHGMGELRERVRGLERGKEEKGKKGMEESERMERYRELIFGMESGAVKELEKQVRMLVESREREREDIEKKFEAIRRSKSISDMLKSDLEVKGLKEQVRKLEDGVKRVDDAQRGFKFQMRIWEEYKEEAATKEEVRELRRKVQAEERGRERLGEELEECRRVMDVRVGMLRDEMRGDGDAGGGSSGKAWLWWLVKCLVGWGLGLVVQVWVLGIVLSEGNEY